MKEQIKRRRIFYVPGMISLVLIPFFCLIHFYKTNAFLDERCIDIYFPNDSVNQKILAIKRNYKVFDFNSNEALENKKLKNLQITLNKLNRENDTVKGVKIHLGNKMKYEVYIKILDLFIVEKMQTYTQYKNDFYVLVLPKPKPSKFKVVPVKCGYWEVNKMYFLEQKREARFQYVFSLYKKYWILFLGYAGIVFLNAFALVKFNKNKYYNQKRYI